MTSPASRPHPFDLVFADFRAERFPAIRDALGDKSAIDDFMLATPAIELMRELRPEGGLGDAVDDFVALMHAAYLYWRDGEDTRVLSDIDTRAIIAGTPVAAIDVAGSHYVQVTPRLIWGRLVDDAPFEPLDGWFVLPAAESLRMVACFGVHAERPGLSVVALQGARPDATERADGTPLFSPTLPGAGAAGLAAVIAPAELLLLAWRARTGKETP